MNQVDAMRTNQFAHLTDDARKYKSSGGWQAELARQGEIPDPLCRYFRFGGLEPFSICGLQSKDLAADTDVRKWAQRFSNEGPLRIVAFGRIKRGKRQDTQSPVFTKISCARTHEPWRWRVASSANASSQRGTITFQSKRSLNARDARPMVRRRSLFPRRYRSRSSSSSSLLPKYPVWPSITVSGP